jgi:hypothetical protein
MWFRSIWGEICRWKANNSDLYRGVENGLLIGYFGEINDYIHFYPLFLQNAVRSAAGIVQPKAIPSLISGGKSSFSD